MADQAPTTNPPTIREIADGARRGGVTTPVARAGADRPTFLDLESGVCAVRDLAGIVAHLAEDIAGPEPDSEDAANPEHRQLLYAVHQLEILSSALARDWYAAFESNRNKVEAA